MTDRYLVEQVCGYFGLVFWSLQLAPQGKYCRSSQIKSVRSFTFMWSAYKTYRRGTSTGVSVWTMLIWTFAGVFIGVYNIGLGVAIGLWIQPQIFTFISCICVSQEFRYQHGWSKLKTFCGFAASCVFVGGLEAGLIFAFKVSYHICDTHVSKHCYQWMTHMILESTTSEQRACHSLLWYNTCHFCHWRLFATILWNLS